MTGGYLYVAGPDLPSKWDGRRVVWRGWNDHKAFVCRRRTKSPDAACDACGALRPPMVNLGVLDPEPGATFTVPKVQRSRSGRSYFRDVVKAAWPIVDLVAFRCVGCYVDCVWQMSTDEFWTLDPGDYGPAGSTERNDS